MTDDREDVRDSTDDDCVQGSVESDRGDSREAVRGDSNGCALNGDTYAEVEVDNDIDVTVDPDRVDEVEGNDDGGFGVFIGDGIGSVVILPLNGTYGRDVGTWVMLLLWLWL